jgi:ATP-binding cassette subfamily F protein uup
VEERKRQLFLKRELEWVRRGPRARRTKSKSRLDDFYETSSRESYPEELNVDLIIPPADRLGKKVVELKNTAVKMGDKVLFRSFNFKFEAGRKIGVVGPNGIGKTSLLKLILGEIPPYEGKIEVGDNVAFNYIDQERIHLSDEDTVINAIGEGSEVINFGKQKLTVWTYLRRFLFSDDRINTLVGKLSGGEKSRLTLAKILSSGGNFILLDEPTNDLDLPTLRVLEEALLAFEGCVVVVSHDRYFLNRICDGILAFEGKEEIYFSEGNYDYYIEKRKLRQKEEELQSTVVKKEDTRQKPKQKKLTYREAQELDSIEDKIISEEEEIERIEKIFSSPDFFEKHAQQTNQLRLELEEKRENVRLLYERWEELERKKTEIG